MLAVKLKYAFVALLAGVVALAAATCACLQPIKTSLNAIQSDAQTLQITDRHGEPLTISYQNRWNVYDTVPLYAIPNFLQQAFIQSEDKRFFEHGGVDWQARLSALWQDVKSRRIVRGASTISEQVVRMVNPRQRNIWSKWLEGIEATLLERGETKADILEFYLNQVPYAANRRGVVEAARYYFGRDLSTLNRREMLALAVLARAPSSYDLYKHPGRVEGPVNRLADALVRKGLLSAGEAKEMRGEPFQLEQPEPPVNAEHFAAYVRSHTDSSGNELHTTLDAGLQEKVQKIVDDRVRGLARRNVHNAGAIVVDYTTGEILAWVAAGANDPKAPGSDIDAVTTPRQPGSAQKPLLYGLALDSGWTPATIIDDAPLSEAIGKGLHNFKNYSNIYYGHVTLREALGNSLNIPALLTINHVGTRKYLDTLHRMGFESLDRSADVYDEGLALGNGEVTLLELVQGFATLANRGVFRPLRFLLDDAGQGTAQRIYSPEAASLIGNILSDPWARRLEFGANSILDLPLQTAAKTGTSTDYRDAWTVAYNYKYVVGMWMGNLDETPTDGLTGAVGPALAVRSIFNELNKGHASQPLWLSPKLVRKDVCIEDPQDSSRCYMRSELFIPGTEPGAKTARAPQQHFDLVKPTDGLQMAIDPRIPMDMQKLPFTLHGLKPDQEVEWVLNGKAIATSGEEYLWPLTRGHFLLSAHITENGRPVYATPEISYIVK